MFRIVLTRTIRRLQNKAMAEMIKRQASDNTASQLLNLRDEVKKEMLIAGMPDDANIRDLIRWHREQASWAESHKVGPEPLPEHRHSRSE